MSERDFRYEMPDGSILEAFQLHEGSRYQEDMWPEWFNSRLFVTSENEAGKKTHYLKVGEAETEIPEYGWLVRGGDGKIRVVDYTEMEKATKVVREPPKIPDEAKPMAEAALRLAAKMTKRPFEEVVEEDLANVEMANMNRQKLIDSMHPDDAAAGGYVQTDAEPVMGDQFADDYEPDDPPRQITDPAKKSTGHIRNIDRGTLQRPPPATSTAEADRGLLFEVRAAYQLLLGTGTNSSFEKGMEKLHDALIERCNWCDCAPGRCDGAADMWDCRRNSPLAQSNE